MSSSLAAPPIKVELSTPSLSERLLEHEPITEDASSSLKQVCSGCGLTEDILNQTGLLGCARCYQTFALLVAAAVEELHGVRVPSSYLNAPPSHRTITNPWPTRRGIRL